eukprot:COSAG02_NODE_49665_length_325_cov_0.911504_1_plen_23_part_01
MLATTIRTLAQPLGLHLLQRAEA